MKNFIISLTFILLSFSLSITLQYCTNQEKIINYENEEKIQKTRQSDNIEQQKDEGEGERFCRENRTECD